MGENHEKRLGFTNCETAERREEGRMLRVGLTGGLGSGKSTVAGIFEELGAAVISADQLGRQLMQPGEPVYAAIVQTFGVAVVRADACSIARRWPN